MCKIRFNINASDSDGTINAGEGRYRIVGTTSWTVFAIANINLPETPDITVEGDYELQVRVQDNDGAYNTDDFVSSPNFKIGNCTANQLPVANAGVDRTIQLPTSSIVLDGSASNDPDGTIATYYWVVTGGNLDNANIQNPTWSNLVEGNFTATLTVTDNDGGQNSDTMNVTVQAAIVYQNTQQSQAFTKDSCGTGATGSTETYVVLAGTYQSTVSQADANNQAINDVQANGQAYANANGTCTNIPPTITGVTYPNGNCCEPVT